MLGLVCGLLAALIASGLFVVEDLYRRLPVPDLWHPVIGAAAFATLGLLVPRALGVGYDVIDDALAGRLALGTLALLAVGKLVIWWIALASGTSGGTLGTDPDHQLHHGRPASASWPPTPSRVCTSPPHRWRWWRWPPRSAPPPEHRSLRSCSSSS